jgi:hypothetical protein
MSQINIIPQPVRSVQRKGTFVLNSDTVILASASARRTALQLASALAPATGLWLKIQSSSREKSNRIELRLDARLKRLGREGYTLSV